MKMWLNSERKYEKLCFVLLFFLHLQKESYCYQLTGLIGCKDRYIWMTGGTVSCKLLTHPSRHLLHMNPKFYCTEYPLTRCCETCTILERHKYRILNGVNKQTTDIPTTTVDFMTVGLFEASQGNTAVKTFFTVPDLQIQQQTTVSPITKMITNTMHGTDSVTKHTQTIRSMPVSTVITQLLPNVTQAVLYSPNTDRTVEQFFTLPTEIQRFDQTNPAMVTVKYSDTSMANENISAVETTPPSETHKMMTWTQKMVTWTQKTLEPKTETFNTRPQTTTTSSPTGLSPTTTTSSPTTLSTTTTTATSSPTESSPITSSQTKLLATSTAATISTAASTLKSTTLTSTTLTTQPTAKPAQQTEVIKKSCTDVGIWIVAGSVPCNYLMKDNKYGLNKNQLYFCNKYPLTSCCETCEKINRVVGK